MYEADPRHAETLIEAMGLEEAKPLSTPGSKEPVKGEEEAMGKEDHTRYRAMAARCNYLSLDRPDIQFAAKEVCRWMQGPTWADWTAIKRIARYLRGKPRVVYHYKWQERPSEIIAHSDTNWAGCVRTRK